MNARQPPRHQIRARHTGELEARADEERAAGLLPEETPLRIPEADLAHLCV
ncbi:hypothetical protein GCM10023220_55410 [Streptomyces ziwulingensis]|uniref:Uncharacterized protein n=1 Tax=Streptomyces ziwulingensis TaxID=1045501 RepID=A0ABP9CQ00_9ACTN